VLELLLSAARFDRASACASLTLIMLGWTGTIQFSYATGV
jgi:hypothetical protein